MSAAPTGAGEALPSLEEIENWPTQHLDDAATRWRAAATKSVEMFEQHHRNVVSPAGTEWRGLGNDAAASRAAGDLAVVRYHADVKRESADLAASGATDISAVKRLVLDAINDAEDDGFTVNPDLSVTDARTYDINTIQDRNKAAKEHADFIRFRAQQLVATDALFGRRLAAKAVELQGIKFDGEGGGHGAHVQLVDNKTTASGGDKEKPGEKPGGTRPPTLDDMFGPATDGQTGHIGPFAVPKDVADAAKHPDGKPPDSNTGDPSGLGSLLGTDDSLEHKPGDPTGSGLPQVLSQLSPAPDRATIDRQQAKVAAAERALTAAQAKADASASDAIVLGPGAGPSRDSTDALGQAVFDARRDLTEQRQILIDLNAYAAAHGQEQVPVPALPENTQVQAPTPVPRESFMDAQRWTNHYLHEATGGLVPDLFQDAHTATHWSEATPAERAQLIADAAGAIPLPGMKLGAEGLEHLAGPAAEALAHDAPSVVAHGAPPIVAHELHAGGEHGGTAHTGDVPVSGDQGLIGHGGDAAPIQLDLTTDHARALGMDPATGGFRAAESETGLRVEQELGVDLSRAGRGDAHDWVDAVGRTYDAVGNFPSKFFDSQWPNLQGRILDHLEKAEIVPVDVSQFTAAQREVVREFVEGLRNPNVVIVGGK